MIVIVKLYHLFNSGVKEEIVCVATPSLVISVDVASSIESSYKVSVESEIRVFLDDVLNDVG